MSRAGVIGLGLIAAAFLAAGWLTGQLMGALGNLLGAL